jgi:hypothetical protein
LTSTVSKKRAYQRRRASADMWRLG